MANIKISGASSGIDFSAVIDALTALQRKSVLTLQDRISTQSARKAGLFDLSSVLLALETASSPLADPKFFSRTTATSGDEAVLLGTSGLTAVPGTYLFDVRRLAQAERLTTGGFASETAPVGSGEISIELGGGGLARNTPLDGLLGGTGVDRGVIQLRQTVGGVVTTAMVDLRAAEGVQDVVDAITGNGSIPVTAKVEGDRISLTYDGTGTLDVLDTGTDTTAADLGIAGPGLAAGATRFGAVLDAIGPSTLLSSLNDGAGVRQSAGADFTITASDGSSYSVDIAGATTVGDVLTAIGSATGGAVTASVNAAGNAIELTDTTGGAVSNLSVTPAGTSNAALDLGLLVGSELAGDPTAPLGRDFLSGKRLIADLNGVLARSLNGGSSLFYADGSPVAAPDIQGVAAGSVAVTDSTGATTTVDLSSRLRTAVTGVVSPDTLTIAGAADLHAGQVVRLTDGSVNEYATVASTIAVGGGAFDVTFTAPVSAGVGAGAFRSRETVAEIEGELNRAGAGSFTVGLNSAGNGLALTDIAGGAGSLTAAESGSTTARDLGLVNASLAGSVTSTAIVDPTLAGLDSRTFVNRTLTVTSGAGAGFTATVTAFDSATGTLTLSGDPSAALVAGGDSFQVVGSATMLAGADVDVQSVAENTALASLNSGRGVQPGKIRITDRAGISFTVDLSQADDTQVNDVIDETNAAASFAGSTLRARINDAGDGIELFQAAGAGSIRVDEVSGGRTARDLRLLGTAPAATPGFLNGTFEVRIAIASGDSLDAIVTKINALGLPIAAAVLKDGAPGSPFRLTFISTASGAIGRVVVDTNVGSLTAAVTAAGQDALLLSGGGAGADPTLIRSGSNTVKDAVAGLTLDLRSTGVASVTVKQDTEGIAGQIHKLVDAFNAAADKIDQLGAFDTATNRAAVLFGDPTLRTTDRRLFDLFNRSVAGLPSGTIRDFESLGVKLGLDGRMSVDEGKLSAALADHLDQVRDFFSLSRPVALDTKLADFRNGLGVERNTNGDDFRITQHDGTTISVSIAGVTSVSQLLDRVNTDSENTGDLAASIAPDGRSIQFTDLSAGAASFRVDPLNGSPTAAQLGLQKAVDGASTLVGDPVDLLRDPGAARRAAEGLAPLTDPGGLVDERAGAIDRNITDLQKRIESAQKRIESTIERLTRRFAALEEFLGLSNNTIGLLQQGLTSLSAFGGGSSR